MDLLCEGLLKTTHHVSLIIFDGGQHVVASCLMVKDPVAVYLVIVVPILDGILGSQNLQYQFLSVLF